MSGDGQKLMGTSSSTIYVSLDGGLTWGRDSISGDNGGWLSCKLSTDGRKGAIKRVYSDLTSGVSSVYLNKPVPTEGQFENLYPGQLLIIFFIFTNEICIYLYYFLLICI